jgi:hypothetical protein
LFEASCNSALYFQQVPVTTNAPSLTVPSSIVALSAPTAGVPLGVLAFKVTQSGVNAGDIMVIEGTKPYSAGIQFVGKRKYSAIKYFTGVVAGAQVNISTEYAAKYGVPSVGQKISLRARTYNISGQSYVKYYTATVVTIVTA